MRDLQRDINVMWAFAYIGIASVIGVILFGLYKFATWIF